MLSQVKIFILLAFLISVIVQIKAQKTSRPSIFCVYNSWNIHRHGASSYSSKNIHPHLCTHLIYMSGILDDENGIRERDINVDQDNYRFFTTLEKDNQNLKTLLSIPDKYPESERFLKMLANRERRVRFAGRAVEFVLKHGFSGIHLALHWCAPSGNGGTDKENYSALIVELKAAIENVSKAGNPTPLLSVAIPPFVNCLQRRYDVSNISKYVDFIHILTHDFHGLLEQNISYQSPLYAFGNDNRNINYVVRFLLQDMNVPKNKLIITLPAYSRTYTLANPTFTGIGSVTDGPGVHGKYTIEDDRWAYFEVCQEVNKENGWTIKGGDSKTPQSRYAYKGNQWISFDDISMIEAKTNYALTKQLGGVSFVSIDMDDFRGLCFNKSYPLISAARKILFPTEDVFKMKSPTTPIPEEDPVWTRFRQFDVNKEVRVDSSSSEPSIEPSLVSVESLENASEEKNALHTEACLECETENENTPLVIKIESKITLDSNIIKAGHKRKVATSVLDELPETVTEYGSRRKSARTKQQTEQITAAPLKQKSIPTKSVETSATKKLVCYYPSWSIGFKGLGQVHPEDIDATLCTHIIYAFSTVGLNNTIQPIKDYEKFDITQGGYDKMTKLKNSNKELKVLIAIGGWNVGKKDMSALAEDPARRKAFAQNAVTFLRNYNFDGIDMDWQFPDNDDKENFVQLMKEVDDEFLKESERTSKSPLSLSMSIPSNLEFVEKGYNLVELAKYVEFMSLLTYDLYNANEETINHHAPLYNIPEHENQTQNINHVVNFIINKGVDTNKLVLGIPLYGRTYTLADETMTAIGSSASGPGRKGPSSNEAGYLMYYEICTNLKDKNKWTVKHRDKTRLGPYAYYNDQWVGYDDADTVRMKTQYANDKKLAGIMFWNIAFDDARGVCSNSNGVRFPLITAGKEVLLRAKT